MQPHKQVRLSSELMAQGFLGGSDLEGAVPPLGRQGLKEARRRHESTFVEGGPLPRFTDAEAEGLIGRSLCGYRTESIIARGSMSVVYRCRHADRDQQCAIKIIPLREWSAGMILQFVKEANMLARLDDAHVIPIYESGVEDEMFFIVMPLIRGQSLQQSLEQQERLAESEVQALADQILQGLGHAHAQGVVHRDLKPANILLDAEGRVLIIDFGLALDLRLDGEGVHVVGTPPYIAPEVWRGLTPDGRSDLYALGVILFQALTGTLPFWGETPAQFRKAHLREPPPDPHKAFPNISAQFGRIVQRVLAKAPEERFPDAEALRQAILQIA